MENITIESVSNASTCLNLGQDMAVVDDVKSIIMPGEAKRMRCFLFGFVDKGKAKYTIDTIEHNVKAGDSLIVSAGQVMDKIEISPDCEARTVFVSEQYVQEILSGMRDLSSIFLFTRLHPIFTLTEEEVKSIRSFYLLLKQKLGEPNHRFRRDTVRSLLQAFLYDAGNIYWKALDNSQKPNSRSEEIFMSFIILVEKNFRHERRVGWYANELNITHKYLSETVKQVSSRTPGDWIDNYVMHELRVELRNSNLTIKEIAAKMHFPSQSFLGKYFKVHTGMSPKEYRNR